MKEANVKPITITEIKNMMKSYAVADLNCWYKQELPLTICRKKYLHADETHPAAMIFRVCSILKPDLGRKVAELMIRGSFFPGGRSLYGAGSKGKFNATMSNCYVMPSPEDSLDGIYESNKQIAKIFKSGGGIGIDLSTLRPSGAKTNNAARTSTGAVSFMHLYNTTGSIIGFHGRRGATLIGLKVSHPDIEEFVDLRTNNDMSAMNISCIIDDEFMDAVENDTDYKLYFYVKETKETIEKTIKAKELYHKICYMNWDYGDPGMLFKSKIDNYNFQQYNPKFKIDICNPCAEYTGPAYNSCNLGSMNLYNYIVEPFSKEAAFDIKSFTKDVKVAIEALDSILDYGYDMQPLKQNRTNIDDWRSIGLGFFGFADALIALGIKYGSEESIQFARKVCNVLTSAALIQSSILGRDGKSFKNFDMDAFLKADLAAELKQTSFGKMAINQVISNKGMRNAQLISIAPTGSLSLLAGMCSSGIEPIFKCTYNRSTHNLEKDNISFQVADKAVYDLLKYHALDPKTMTATDIKQKFPFVVEATDIEPLQRVKIQAAMQSQIDNAISSTINLPESITVEEVEEIYMQAYKMGLKGLTVFRDNCKRASILNFAKEEKKEEKDLIIRESKQTEISKDELLWKPQEFIPQSKTLEKIDLGIQWPHSNPLNQIDPVARKGKGPLEGRTYRKRTACVNALYVTVNRDEDNNIFEVFTNKSVHGCSANIATITRLVSLALRSGVKVETIIKELKENSCQACQEIIKKHPEYGCSLSCPYAIAEALEEEYIKTRNAHIVFSDAKCVEDLLNKEFQFLPKNHIEYNTETGSMKCPDCRKSTLIHEGKCMTCKSCGYSKCD